MKILRKYNFIILIFGYYIKYEIQGYCSKKNPDPK